MKNILFLANGPLKNPVKGTPIRINSFLSQIARDHRLIVCADDMDDIDGVSFKPYPRDSKLKTLVSLISLVKTEKVDIIFITSELLIPLVVFLKIWTRRKIAIDLHGLYFEEWYYYQRINFLSKWWRELKIRFFLLWFDLVFVVSEKLKNYYRYNNKNIKVIHGGVDLSMFPTPETKEEASFTIGYMGNARPYQGLDNLLAAASAINTEKIFDFKLNLIISGREEDFYKVIDQYNLRDKAEVQFNVSHDLVGPIMARSDVLIITRPSLKMTEYAFPSKLTEYLATGITTIVTKVGPVAELFSDESHCLIINHETAKADLKEALIKLQQLNSDDRKAIGLRGREFVSQNLTWDILGKKINQAFDQL